MKINYENIISSPYFEKFTDSLLVVAVLFTVYFILSKIVQKRTTNLNEIYNWKKISAYIVGCFGLFFLGRIWINAIQPVFTFLGIIAAALTISQKESIMNLTGGLFIIWRGLFSIGDRIKIAKFRGDVVGHGLFYFVLLEVGDFSSSNQSTGRIMRVPNGLVLANPVVNYTQFFPYLWRELSVVLLPESNRDKAMEILLETVEIHTRQFVAPARRAIEKTQKKEAIIFRHFDPKVYMSIQMSRPGGIKLTARYICAVRSIRDTDMKIWQDVLDQFDRHNDINISYDIE